jgi:anti-sigma B factor antagonist
LSLVRACVIVELRNEGTTMPNVNMTWETATQLQVEVKFDGLQCRVRLGGELDMATAAQLRDALNVVCAGRHRLVVIDLEGLRFLSLAGLHVLADARQALQAAGRRLVLANPDAITTRVLALTGLDQTFGLAPAAEHRNAEVALGSRSVVA